MMSLCDCFGHNQWYSDGKNLWYSDKLVDGRHAVRRERTEQHRMGKRPFDLLRP